jgi:hypothetical protein
MSTPFNPNQCSCPAVCLVHHYDEQGVYIGAQPTGQPAAGNQHSQSTVATAHQGLSAYKPVPMTGRTQKFLYAATTSSKGMPPGFGTLNTALIPGSGSAHTSHPQANQPSQGSGGHGAHQGTGQQRGPGGQQH